MNSSANFVIRAASLEPPPRKSPAGTPRIARQLQLPVADSNRNSSMIPTSKSRSPKVPERKSPRSLVSEQKQPSRVADLETKLAQLQEDYKKTKDQLNVSESCKRQAQKEAQDTKKQLAELTDCDDTRIEELCKISHDRDRVWQSELESIQKQHAIDSAALSTAMNEIKRLKNQLHVVSESEATQMEHAESAHAELQGLRIELTETLSLVERMKCEVSDCRRSEAEAMEAVSETQRKLEASNESGDKSRLDCNEAMQACKRLALELEQSRAEMSQLRSDLEVSKEKYQEEYIQSTLEIRRAYEQVEQAKLEASRKEAQLRKARAKIDELNEALRSNKIEESKNLASEKQYEEVEMKLKKVKASLLKKESEVHNLAEENEALKKEMKKGEEAVNAEMESELRRVKVQADQWRKAAEAAASMLDNHHNNNNNNNDVRYTTMAGSLDSPFSEDMDDYDEDDEDESTKKKNGNMLKKIGVVLWKKGHK